MGGIINQAGSYKTETSSTGPARADQREVHVLCQRALSSSPSFIVMSLDDFLKLEFMPTSLENTSRLD